MCKINVRARELDPERTHSSRLRAFYVKMDEAGAGWWRPWSAFDDSRSSGQILEAEATYDSRRSDLEVLKKKVEHIDISFAGSLFLPPELN